MDIEAVFGTFADGILDLRVILLFIEYRQVVVVIVELIGYILG